MSSGLWKMWLALISLVLMFLSAALILWSRYKLKGFLRFLIAVVAYGLMIFAGLIVLVVVFSGPGSN
ncbi:MAG: DUF2768 domain-containing protein [Caldibacillus debilis]|uniref:DUF2768 domain-containing protein n=2 Tax=Caldibacillus debilis TaxID=301148 RepID=A0A420VFA4_9BACI|nr:DUF2768 domain-containing protein [Caldibacillus debilis]MBO2480785.1 DUF2768 domain-containing protein [Bacillaceae bacterium]KYD20245.1 hypothetical protein B4135_2021 [Caldibacillus debilis]MBY6271547.1 DUF2768 domain-containing protein [Bacillaceae bacterium]OUM93033.1 MAG: hypothetical protein BAA03_06385 [Caldibacillus debilis]REJ16544.1 MAG: DUF2768 domain-containing protein [Caldibacillus debilis]